MRIIIEGADGVGIFFNFGPCKEGKMSCGKKYEF